MGRATLSLFPSSSVAIIDAADFERADRCRWFLYTERDGITVHVARNAFLHGKYSVQFLECFLLDTGWATKAPVRFVDGNRLNCTRANLVVE
jgi:hypothetical protein